ncbi:dephospho-CoA kinase [candidate division KSB1 bacterium 4484_87]|nr:MAG: dephospho-CoA kinase [candidate division KSB1 bacterium 4484_87]
MLKLGITGGIGCGKSEVSHLLRQRRIPVFAADRLAKILMNHDQEVRVRLVDLLGEVIYQPDGKLNRDRMAEILFSDPEMRGKVNDIVHPRVIQYEHQLLEKIAKTGKRPIACVEAALIFEAGSHVYYDVVVVVSASKETIFERLKRRDNFNEAEIERRIRSQMPLEEKIRRADYVIRNDGTLEDLANEVDKFIGFLQTKL